MEQLIKYLSKYITLPQAEVLSSIFEEKEYSHGDLLTKEGRYSNQIGCIKDGMARAYFINENGDEVTVWFSFPGMMIFDPQSFYSETMSTLTIEFLEDSIVFITTKQKLDYLYEQQPELNLFGRKFAEAAFSKMIQRTTELQTLNAEERYLQLLKTPELLQKIPLKYLASYIGVTKYSLSRIRKNISL